MLAVTPVQRSRIRAIAAHLWQTKEEFNILDGCCCIIGHARCMPEMKLAGLEESMFGSGMVIDGALKSWHQVAEWLGLAPEFFAIDATFSLIVNMADGSREWTASEHNQGPWTGCVDDPKGAAIMLLTAIGEMGPPERTHVPHAAKQQLLQELETA